MAKLFINKDITAEEQKELHYWFTGADSVSFTDIHDFLNNIPDSDKSIDIEIHSCGGDCSEGYAIYDALRTSGKEISCTVVGRCASMATIILLSAPKERRMMYKHADMLIHKPYYPGYCGNLTIEKLTELKTSLETERNKMLAIYKERTGAKEEDLTAQMDADEFFGVEKAIALGFVSGVVPEASAAVTGNNLKISYTMNKNENKAEAKNLWQKLGAALGLGEDPEPVSMTLTSTDGRELTVEREDGDIQVGDKAEPDGDFTLEDGRIVTVKDGAITEIKPTEPTEPTNTNADEEKAALEDKIKELQSQIDELKQQAKTDADKAILATVEKAGGQKWLEKAAASHYDPATRKQAAGQSNSEDLDAFMNKKIGEN